MIKLICRYFLLIFRYEVVLLCWPIHLFLLNVYRNTTIRDLIEFKILCERQRFEI